ncbi:MAG TPA: hypothetical protein PK821_04625, partial [Victivallales bacterium]|nr:hypothetical protein [Victivallales bacterium]
MMKLKIINIGEKKTLHPLNIGRKISDLKIAGEKYSDILKRRLETLNFDAICSREDFYPSDA